MTPFCKSAHLNCHINICQAELEKASPQLIGADSELWVNFIKRDIPNWRNKLIEPKNPASWYKVYRKLVKETEDETEQQELELEEQMRSIQAAKASRTTKRIDPKNAPKLPLMGGMRPEKRRNVVDRLKPVISTLSFTSGSKTKTLTGAGVITKAKREAKEMALLRGRNSALTTPSHMLANQATRIQAAPRGLVDEHKRAPTIMVPRKASTNELMPREEIERRKAAKKAREERAAPLEDDEEDYIRGRYMGATPPKKSMAQPSGGYKMPKRALSNSPEREVRPVVRTKATKSSLFMPSKRRRPN